ncbi:hypothetical protein PPERSA_02448 [Pseudocohnilembus persalinus]|uniref:Uncharacterized protein n=1 Tax=Pseudocohnilembus persalinus TaxID=266149 RepID=A0A0V0QAV2_PSEPJ|nr:hypothetical protein PPERSA_02448 [Pseudocohnilembus persalinus]|eukprot:KRW99336.1 hypothetical protein PPERSA_02448 [Pseudocohnilembus persalinus]
MTSQSHHTQQQIEFPPYELEITLDRSSGIYKEQEWISGFVKVIHPDEEQFNPIYSKSLKIQGEGFLTAQNRQTNKQLESITSQNYSEELFKVQTVAAEDQQVTYKDTFAFKFKLQPNKNQKLLETYVGVYISVSYEINCTMKLQSGQKIQGVLPFYVQCPGQGKENIKGELVIPRPQQIEMSPEKLLIQNPNQRIPDFKIIGKLESDIDYFQNDIKGSFIIEECDGTVRTIDLQLIRVEKIENEKVLS